MKNDARVRYTQQALKNALLKILDSKPINKITVREVCEEAQLNRATFYSHYTDCYDLLGQIEDDLLRDFRESLKYLESFDLTALINGILTMIDKNIGLCKTVIFKNPHDAIIKKMIEMTHDSAIQYWRSQLRRAGDDELEMLFSCLANGLLTVVVEGYEKYDRARLVSFVNTVVKRSLAAYM